MGNLENIMNGTKVFLETYKTRDPLIQNLEALVSIDKNDLDEEIIKNPSRFAWVAVLAEEAEVAEARAKREYESMESLTDLGIRSGAIPLPEGISKLTEGVIEAIIKSDENLKEEYGKYLQAKHQANTMKRIVQSLVQKSDMLRTFSSNVRKELESDFDVKKEVAKKVLKASKESRGDQ